MKKMNDLDATHGPYRAIRCEWLGGKIDEDEICDELAITGKPYCSAHYVRAYEEISDEQADEHFDGMVKETPAEREV